EIEAHLMKEAHLRERISDGGVPGGLTRLAAERRKRVGRGVVRVAEVNRDVEIGLSRAASGAPATPSPAAAASEAPASTLRLRAERANEADVDVVELARG